MAITADKEGERMSNVTHLQLHRMERSVRQHTSHARPDTIQFTRKMYQKKKYEKRCCIFLKFKMWNNVNKHVFACFIYWQLYCLAHTESFRFWAFYVIDCNIIYCNIELLWQEIFSPFPFYHFIILSSLTLLDNLSSVDKKENTPLLKCVVITLCVSHVLQIVCLFFPSCLQICCGKPCGVSHAALLCRAAVMQIRAVDLCLEDHRFDSRLTCPCGDVCLCKSLNPTLFLKVLIWPEFSTVEPVCKCVWANGIVIVKP